MSFIKEKYWFRINGANGVNESAWWHVGLVRVLGPCASLPCLTMARFEYVGGVYVLNALPSGEYPAFPGDPHAPSVMEVMSPWSEGRHSDWVTTVVVHGLVIRLTLAANVSFECVVAILG